MATPTALRMILSMYLGYGAAGSDRPCLDFDEPSTVTGNAIYQETMELAASATDTSLDLSTKMDTIHAVAIREISGNTAGAKYGPAAGAGNKFNLGGSKAVVLRFKTDDTPPTLYFTNPDASNKLFLEITAIGNRS